VKAGQVVASRPYRSEVRRDQARDTHRRILAAAEELLLAGGYASMTIARLAEAAAVSPQTVYNSIGSKAQVIKALYDVRLAGDDEPVPMRDRPEMLAVRQAPTAAETLRRYVAFSRLLYERVGPLLSALSTSGSADDPTLAEFLATIDKERRIGNSVVVADIDARFGLAAQLDVPRAVDIVWTLTSPQVADLLLRRCGWTIDAWAGWLADTLIHSLLGTTEELSSPDSATASPDLSDIQRATAR
jgi:AcrR family transcriptional regulator